MIKYIILLISISFSFSNFSDKLNSKPLKSNALKISELKKLTTENGFYDRIYSALSKTGMIVVADVGNRTVNVFDSNYKLLKSFGKEGTGPGEMQNVMGLGVSADRIFLRSHFNRLSIYDYNGKFIKDINTFEFGSGDIIFNEKIYFKYRDDQKYKLVVYSEDGELEKKIENKNYKEPEGTRGGMRMVISGSPYIALGNGFVKGERGEYQFKMYDNNFNELESYTKDYQRVKRDASGFNFNMRVEGVSKKKQAEMQAQARDRMLKQLGEFEDDVNAVLGAVDGYLILSVASDANNKLILDVINPDKKYFTQVELEGDEIISSTIQNGKLLVNYKNEEDGPYLKIYNLSILN